MWELGRLCLLGIFVWIGFGVAVRVWGVVVWIVSLLFICLMIFNTSPFTLFDYRSTTQLLNH